VSVGEQGFYFCTPRRPGGHGGGRCKKRILAPQRGFTLIETLLAVTLFAIASASSFGIFSMGISIWKRSQGSSLEERKAVLGLEKMAADIRTAVRVTASQETEFSENRIEYKGEGTGFFLPAIVRRADADQKSRTQYGRVGWRWNRSTKELCRTLEGAGEIYRRETAACVPEASRIRSVRFQYYAYAGLADSYSWHDSWETRQGFPLAVQISLELEPAGGEKYARPRLFKRTVLLPVGGK